MVLKNVLIQLFLGLWKKKDLVTAGIDNKAQELMNVRQNKG